MNLNDNKDKHYRSLKILTCISLINLITLETSLEIIPKDENQFFHSSISKMCISYKFNLYKSI